MLRTTLMTVIVAMLICLSAPAQAERLQSHAFQVRLGGFLPSGGGDLWTENQDVFTQESSDFGDFTWGLSFATALSNNVEVGMNVDWYRSNVTSGYRDYVDQDGFAILHDTNVSKMPLTVDLRLLPAGRYRRLSDGGRALRPVFYLGGGGGLNLWSYEEVGDFIDFDTSEIFLARFKDSGAAWEAHAMAGLELPVNPGFTVLFEGRYSWSKAELGGDLAGLGRIDLGGPSAYVGGSFRF
jgi:hypothetical protein